MLSLMKEVMTGDTRMYSDWLIFSGRPVVSIVHVNPTISEWPCFSMTLWSYF